MALADLFPELDKLSRVDKLRIIQHLAQDLESTETPSKVDFPYSSESAYEVWSPQVEGGAVAALQKALEDYKKSKDAR